MSATTKTKKKPRTIAEQKRSTDVVLELPPGRYWRIVTLFTDGREPRIDDEVLTSKDATNKLLLAAYFARIGDSGLYQDVAREVTVTEPRGRKGGAK